MSTKHDDDGNGNGKTSKASIQAFFDTLAETVEGRRVVFVSGQAIDINEVSSAVAEILTEITPEQVSIMTDPTPIDWNGLKITITVEGGNDRARQHLQHCPVHQRDAAEVISEALGAAMITEGGKTFIAELTAHSDGMTMKVLSGGGNIGMTKSA